MQGSFVFGTVFSISKAKLYGSYRETSLGVYLKGKVVT